MLEGFLPGVLRMLMDCWGSTRKGKEEKQILDSYWVDSRLFLLSPFSTSMGSPCTTMNCRRFKQSKVRADPTLFPGVKTSVNHWKMRFSQSPLTRTPEGIENCNSHVDRSQLEDLFTIKLFVLLPCSPIKP